MDLIVWGGAALSAIGLLGIVWSIRAVAKLKKADLEDDAMKAEMQKIIPVNIGALMLSILGLGAISVGLILGA